MILKSNLDSMKKVKEFDKWLHNYKRNKYKYKR